MELPEQHSDHWTTCVEATEWCTVTENLWLYLPRSIKYHDKFKNERIMQISGVTTKGMRSVWYGMRQILTPHLVYFQSIHNDLFDPNQYPECVELGKDFALELMYESIRLGFLTSEEIQVC